MRKYSQEVPMYYISAELNRKCNSKSLTVYTSSRPPNEPGHKSGLNNLFNSLEGDKEMMG